MSITKVCTNKWHLFPLLIIPNGCPLVQLPGLRWPVQTRRCSASGVPSPAPGQSGVIHLRRGRGSHREVPQDQLQVHHGWQGKRTKRPAGHVTH